MTGNCHVQFLGEEVRATSPPYPTEDANRTRGTNAGANLGVIRRVAASLLKQDRSRGSIKAKRFNAALGDKYLKQFLQGFEAH